MPRKLCKEVIEQSVEISFLSGRPERDTVICQDDIINLKIALATTNADEFINLL